uniref:Phosphorylated adapter RNA export protein n=1 Tax=Setaria digitata TaxID=48799 RepID=A0A915Q409_9BILA
MYRVNKSYDESSSDDEGPSLRKEQKLDNVDDPMRECKIGRLANFFSKAAQMWTDLLDEQSLSETFSGKVGVYRGANDVVERGVESYTLPDVRSINDDQEMRCQLKRGISPTTVDSGPFDFIADEERVGKFPDKYESCSNRCGGRSRSHSRKGSRSFIGQETNGKEFWKHSASTSRSTSHGNERPRLNSYNTKSDHLTGKNPGKLNNYLKRRRGDRNVNALASGSHSLETLMKAEFPQNISIGELAERIIKALDERNGNVIFEIGEKKALELFHATRDVEASGGMLIADGTRRRTPGGVFMTLFKTDPDVLPVLKEKVCNLQKAAAREIRIAKRKGKKAAQAFDVALKQVDDLKELSTASDVLLEKQSRKENPV